MKGAVIGLASMAQRFQGDRSAGLETKSEIIGIIGIIGPFNKQVYTYTTLSDIALCCLDLYSTASLYFILHDMTIHCIELYRAKLHRIALRQRTLHCIALGYSTLSLQTYRTFPTYYTLHIYHSHNEHALQYIDTKLIFHTQIHAKMKAGRNAHPSKYQHT